jgi:hypothetical protein
MDGVKDRDWGVVDSGASRASAELGIGGRFDGAWLSWCINRDYRQELQLQDPALFVR